MQVKIDYCKCERSSCSELEKDGFWVVCGRCRKVIMNPFENRPDEKDCLGNRLQEKIRIAVMISRIRWSL